MDYIVHGVAKSWTQLSDCHIFLVFPDSSVGKESTWNAGDLGSIPGLERSTGEGKGYTLQCSGLENSMDCLVQRVAKSRTRPSIFHFHPQFCNLSFCILTGSFTEERF